MSLFAGKFKASPWKATGPATKVALAAPHGLAYDRNPVSSGDPWAGDTFVADTDHCAVRAVSGTGALTTVVNASGKHKVGFCGAPTAGPASSSLVGHVHGAVYDRVHEQLYIADPDNHEVVDVDLSTATPTLSTCPTLIGGTSPLVSPEAVTVHGTTGELWVADPGADVVAHYGYPCASGDPDLAVGVYGVAGWNGDGRPCAGAELSGPTGVDYDAATGALVVSDTNNDEIRSCTGGNISQVLGSPGVAGLTADGTHPGGNVPISAPHGVKADGSGALFYDEVGNNLVRRFDPGTGSLTTVAGGGTGALPTKPGKYPVDATSVALSSPHGIAFVPTSGATADLLFSDTGADEVLRVASVAVPI
jgi:hypothetical protein